MNVTRSVCPRCGLNEGTEKFAEDGTAAAHGWWQMWCKPCVLMRQIEFAEAAVAWLPELKRQLEEAISNA